MSENWKNTGVIFILLFCTAIISAGVAFSYMNSTENTKDIDAMKLLIEDNNREINLYNDLISDLSSELKKLSGKDYEKLEDLIEKLNENIYDLEDDNEDLEDDIRSLRNKINDIYVILQGGHY